MGCAGEDKKPTQKPDAVAEALKGGPPAGYKPGSGPGGDEYRPSDVGLEGELGVLDQGDVDDVIQRDWPRIKRCYDKAGDSQRYASGKVALRFLVKGDGGIDDVLVTDSPVGHWEVERCLVDVGRKMRFPEPGGRKATTFDYAVEFRSTGELGVVNAGPDRYARELEPLRPGLDECGKAGDGVMVTLWVEPSGHVAAAGLASGGRLDAAVASCLVGKLRTWTLPPDAPKSAVRVRLPL